MVQLRQSRGTAGDHSPSKRRAARQRAVKSSRRANVEGGAFTTDPGAADALGSGVAEPLPLDSGGAHPAGAVSG
jgi:hypothetical protein